jgi:hypothetical protein
MSGRPITNHSERARKKREHMRRVRERQRQERMGVTFNAQRLAQAINKNWRTQ